MATVVGNSAEVGKKTTTTSACKVFVGNISYRITHQELSAFFSKFGRVHYSQIVKDHKKKRSRGIGFVTFTDEEAVENVLKASEEDLVLDTRVLRVDRSEPTKRGRLKSSPLASSHSESHSSSPLLSTVDSVEDPPYIVPLLSDDILLLIFSDLELKDFVRIERVCKRWQFLCHKLWRSKTTLHFSSVFNPFQLRQDGRRMSAPYLTDNILLSLLKRACNLQRLDLSASSRFLTDFALDAIGVYCNSLEELDLSGVAVTLTSIRLLCERLPGIKWLKMKGCHEVGEKGLWWMLHWLKELEYLNLESNKRLTGQCFFQSAGNLKTVILNDCVKLTDDGLCLLLERNSQLQVLQCNNCRLLTDKSIRRIAEFCKSMRELHLSCIDSTDRINELHIRSLGILKDLEVLVVDRRQGVDDTLLQNLGENSTKLRRLSCEACIRVTDSGLDSLSTCPNLTDLTVSYCKLTDSGLHSVAVLGVLRRLVVRGCSQLTSKAVSEVVSLSPLLHELDLSGCLGITDSTLYALQQVLTSEREDYDEDIRPQFSLAIGGTQVTTEAVVDFKTITNATIQLHDLSNPTLSADYDPFMHIPSLADEEDWENDDEPPLVLHCSEQSSFDPPQINSRLVERADDFLLADDPALFSDDFSDPEEWDMS